jgi:hypothetical protein
MDFMKGTLFGEAFANSLVQKAWYKDLQGTSPKPDSGISLILCHIFRVIIVNHKKINLTATVNVISLYY